MLETLRRSDERRPLAAPGATVKLHTQDCVMEWAVTEAQVPFIEVGAPGKVVEGSADVMAVAHPAQATQPPHPPVEKALVATTIVAQLTEAKPLSVAFEPWTGPVAGSTGVAPAVIAYHQPNHAISKQYADLWNTMTAGLTGDGHVLLIAGLRPQVGTTTVLLNLAVSAALLAKRRVACVDAQARAPSLAARLGFTPDLGLSEVISGHVALEQAVVKTVVPSLHVLPLTKREDAAMTPEAAAWLLGQLRDRFGTVLVDGPSLDDAAQLAVLAPSCDALFLVAPQGETKSLPRETLQVIARLGGKLRGLLHTHVEL